MEKRDVEVITGYAPVHRALHAAAGAGAAPAWMVDAAMLEAQVAMALEMFLPAWQRARHATMARAGR